MRVKHVIILLLPLTCCFYSYSSQNTLNDFLKEFETLKIEGPKGIKPIKFYSQELEIHINIPSPYKNSVHWFLDNMILSTNTDPLLVFNISQELAEFLNLKGKNLSYNNIIPLKPKIEHLLNQTKKENHQWLPRLYLELKELLVSIQYYENIRTILLQPEEKQSYREAFTKLLLDHPNQLEACQNYLEGLSYNEKLLRKYHETGFKLNSIQSSFKIYSEHPGSYQTFKDALVQNGDGRIISERLLQYAALFDSYKNRDYSTGIELLNDLKYNPDFLTKEIRFLTISAIRLLILTACILFIIQTYRLSSYQTFISFRKITTLGILPLLYLIPLHLFTDYRITLFIFSLFFSLGFIWVLTIPRRSTGQTIGFILFCILLLILPIRQLSDELVHCILSESSLQQILILNTLYFSSFIEVGLLLMTATEISLLLWHNLNEKDEHLLIRKINQLILPSIHLTNAFAIISVFCSIQLKTQAQEIPISYFYSTYIFLAIIINNAAFLQKRWSNQLNKSTIKYYLSLLVVFLLSLSLSPTEATRICLPQSIAIPCHPKVSAMVLSTGCFAIFLMGTIQYYKVLKQKHLNKKAKKK